MDKVFVVWLCRFCTVGIIVLSVWDIQNKIDGFGWVLWLAVIAGITWTAGDFFVRDKPGEDDSKGGGDAH